MITLDWPRFLPRALFFLGVLVLLCYPREKAQRELPKTGFYLIRATGFAVFVYLSMAIFSDRFYPTIHLTSQSRFILQKARTFIAGIGLAFCVSMLVESLQAYLARRQKKRHANNNHEAR